MDAARWSRIKQTFQAVVDLPEGKRPSALMDMCADDPTLIKDVNSLLENHRDDDFINPPSSKRIAAAMEGAETRSRVGRMVGPYRLIEVIDAGGMGHVYLAERADGQFEKQVAVKVIRRSVDTPELRKRFLNEQRALAGLDHPNIAKLLDGGVTDDGLSYLVMDFVQGRPIDEYCNEKQLDIRRRLELFQSVCRAVHFAHQRLIVHRDLKPNNILVTKDGVPKLLDFGISKLQNDDDREEVTKSLSVPFLTPEYASPEQIRGERISTSGDVYSLGVILYELITGLKPHKSQSGSHHELAKLICEQEPTRPSTAVRKTSGTRRRPATDEWSPETIGRIDSLRLQRRLIGDLDNIVLMALRKEPHRRYGSAEQLAEDIRRHLTGLPVIARKDTFTYRATKFVQRNRPGVIAAAVVLMAIIGGIIGTSVALVRVRDAKNKTQLMNEYLQEMLAQANVSEMGRDLTLSEVLDQAADRVSRDFAEHPDIEASLRETIGNAYISLRYGNKAIVQMERALSLRRELAGENSLEVAACLHQLANARMIAGEYEEAEVEMKRAIAIRREFVGDDDAQVAAIMSDYAVLVKEMGEFERAESIYRDALALTERFSGAESPEVASNLNNLAVLMKLRGRLDEAEPLYTRSLDINRANFGEHHIVTANSMGNLATLQLGQGKYQEARTLFEKTLAIYRKILPADHAQTAIAMNNLASLLSSQGEYEASEARFRECLEMTQRIFGVEHRRTATTMHNLSRVLSVMGRYDEAETLCREGLRIREMVLSPDHFLVATSHDGLGEILLSAGKLDEAEEHIETALRIRRATFPEGHLELAGSLENVTLVALERGDLEAADRAVREANEMFRRLLGDSHPRALHCELVAARVAFRLGEFDDALAKLDRVARGLTEKGLINHPWLGSAAVLRGRISAARGERVAALGHVEAGLQILIKRLEPEHPEIRAAMSLRGNLLGASVAADDAANK